MKEMRYDIGNGLGASPLASLVGRALEETGGWGIPNLRATGFRALEAIIEEASRDFRSLAPLPDKSQVVMDKATVEVGLQRLTFVADLLAEGLTYNLTDPLSVTQLEWNKVNKVGAAQRTMTPSARGENKMVITLPTRLPIYLTTDKFELDIRTLKMSQRVGLPLDTTLVKWCTRSVNEAFEDAALNGATTLDGQALVDAGYSAPGVLNESHVNTGNFTLAAWTTAPVGDTIINEIIAAIAVLASVNKFGPFNIYVPTSCGFALDKDFKANGDLTIRERIEKLVYGGRNLRVRTADLLPTNKVVIIQMTSDVVDIVTGQMPTVIPWTSLDGFTIHNLVMGIMIPRVKADYDGHSGIFVGTLA